MDDLQQLPQEVHERMILYLKLKLDIFILQRQVLVELTISRFENEIGRDQTATSFERLPQTELAHRRVDFGYGLLCVKDWHHRGGLVWGSCGRQPRDKY
jgi:hypothetical protein